MPVHEDGPVACPHPSPLGQGGKGHTAFGPRGLRNAGRDGERSRRKYRGNAPDMADPHSEGRPSQTKTQLNRGQFRNQEARRHPRRGRVHTGEQVTRPGSRFTSRAVVGDVVGHRGGAGHPYIAEGVDVDAASTATGHVVGHRSRVLQSD